MSADNWAKCPRCLKQAEAVLDNLRHQVDASYGVVTVEEFDQKRAALAKEEEILNADDTYRTFREDWEIVGAEEGVVTVKYRGACTKCKLSLVFHTEREIPGI